MITEELREMENEMDNRLLSRHVEKGESIMITNNVFTLLENILPHGAGIDADWHFEVLKNGKIEAYNSYHAMDEGGCYTRWYDFTATLSINPDGDFELERVTFRGKLDERVEHAFGIREYIEDTIAGMLSDS